MKAKKITYQQLLKESYPTYYVEWSILGSIINHKTEFHDSKSVKDYILRLEKEHKNVTYTIRKTKKKNIIQI